jgi:GNAT superfamily N-acetyltransferase
LFCVVRVGETGGEQREIMEIEIRPMQEEDLAPGIILITEFFEESLSEYGIELSVDRMRETFLKVWQTSFSLFLDGKLVGVYCGHLVKDFCCDYPAYEEVLWYVEKKHRKYGIKLFECAKRWCEEHGITRMTMCAMANSKTEELTRFYERLGFVKMEIRFLKILL